MTMQQDSELLEILEERNGVQLYWYSILLQLFNAILVISNIQVHGGPSRSNGSSIPGILLRLRQPYSIVDPSYCTTKPVSSLE